MQSLLLALGQEHMPTHFPCKSFLRLLGSWPREGLQESRPGRVWGRQGWRVGVEGSGGPGAGQLDRPQEAPTWRGGGRAQAPLLAPQRPPAEAPAGASRGVSSPVEWEEPTLQERPLVGSDGRGLQGSVLPQAGRAQLPGGEGCRAPPVQSASDRAPGGCDGHPTSHASVPVSGGPARAPVPPRVPGSNLPCWHTPPRCFLDEMSARAPCGQLRRKALSTCRWGPLRRWAWKAWGVALSGREQQLTTQAHVTVEMPTVQLDGNCWTLFCTARPRKQPSNLAPLPPVLGVQGGDRRGDSLSATRWGRTRAAAKAWTRSAGSCRRPTARSWRGRTGPHVRGTPGQRSFPGSRGGALGTPCTRTHVSHPPCAPKGRQGHAFLTGFGNRTENQETTTRQLVKSWLYLSHSPYLSYAAWASTVTVPWKSGSARLHDQ